MAGGAVAAAAAAGHAKRIQAILDAFRVAGATAPTRARTLDELGLVRNGEIDEFVNEGILVSAPGTGAWYLSESAFVARRDAHSGKTVRIVALIVAVAVALLLLGYAISLRA